VVELIGPMCESVGRIYVLPCPRFLPGARIFFVEAMRWSRAYLLAMFGKSALEVLRQITNRRFFNRENVAQAYSNELTIQPNDWNLTCADLSLNDFDMDIPASGYVVVAQQNLRCRCAARFSLRFGFIQSNGFQNAPWVFSC
jgi:hypothetical protein